MKCPRCNSKLGEDDVYCPNCNLSLVDWFMNNNFQSASYDDPYGGFGNGVYDDPYKNIGKKNRKQQEKNPPENAPKEETADKDSRKDITEEESSCKAEPEEKKSDTDSQEENTADNESRENVQTEETADRDGQEETASDGDAKKDAQEKPADKDNQKDRQEEKTADKDPKPEVHKETGGGETEKSKKGGKFVFLIILLLCLCGGYWAGRTRNADMSSPFSVPGSQSSGQTAPTITAQTDVTVTAVPTVEPTATAVPEPTVTPEPTATPEPELTWEGMVSREQQEGVMEDGTWLDRNHMSGLMDVSYARYGLYLMDLTNYTDYMIGEAEVPLPASALIGIPIMYTIAEGIEANTLSLDDPVQFTYTFANGRGNIKAGQNGQFFTLGDLLKEALLYSDNNALNSLIDYLTLSRINDTCHQYGYDSVDMQRKLMTESSPLDNYISPRDAAMMLNAIYQNNFSGIDRTFLMNYFKLSAADTANKGMYPACRDCNIFLNLNGITETRYNEVGLIENDGEVFILAIMTVDGKNETSAPCVTNAAAYILANLEVGKR